MAVELVAPDRKLWSGQATFVFARTTEGEIGILPHHIPLVAELVEGEMVRIDPVDGEEIHAAVHGGFLSVAGLDRFTPDIAAAGGAVHVTYRTRPDNGNSPAVSQNYVASVDNGRTFGFERTIGPDSQVQWSARASGTRIFYGDYMGVAATPRMAALVWNVSGAPPIAGQEFHQTTWTATVLR